jgi:hypothetical protein
MGHKLKCETIRILEEKKGRKSSRPKVMKEFTNTKKFNP